LLLFAVSALAADVSLTMEGVAQGTFYTADVGGKFGVPVSKFSYGMSVPRDAATGLVSGKRLYKAVTITRPISQMSVQLLTAASRNERIKRVVLSTSALVKGLPTIVETVTLTDALIISYDRNADNGAADETISLVYNTIQVDSATRGFIDSTV